jgi:hypothetical protein
MAKQTAAACLVLLLAGGARPAEVLYVRSNGELEQKKGGLFSALYLLDADPSTVWCSAGSGRGAQLEILLDGPTDIEAMEVWNGNQKSEGAFSEFTRVKKMQLSVRDMSHTVELKDERGAQKFSFDPPLKDRRVVIKLLGGYRGSEARHTCLSDLIFYRNKKPLWGKSLRPAILASLPNAEYLGTWVAGPEYARNRELVLSIHNTFFYTFLPDDPAQPSVRAAGAWRVGGGALELVMRKKVIQVKVARDEAGGLKKLRIDSQEQLPEGMDQVYARYKVW